MRPELFVNWAADSCHLDYLKVKKTLKVLLVQLTGTVAYNLHTREVGCFHAHNGSVRGSAAWLGACEEWMSGNSVTCESHCDT